MSTIGVIGAGKLGLPVALAIESRGHEVMVYDSQPEPYRYLEERQIPYQEADLQPLLDTHNITATRRLGDLLLKSDIVFAAPQTPHGPEFEGSTRIPDERADFDYAYLKHVLGTVVINAMAVKKPTTLAVISTCLPGTFERDLKPILNEYVDYVYTPQFIAMGTVLDDYLHPEFNLIGVESEAAAAKLEAFYETINDAPMMRTDVTTAEAIKVSYNTFITMKTVLGNTWGELCHKTGANVDDVFRAWSMSGKRLLSPKYLQSGVGDGGGCHPRDNIALSHLARQVGLSHNIFEDLMAAREDHMAWLAEEAFKQADEQVLPVTILGRSFKPETNIETGSPSVLMANIMREQGYDVDHVEDLEPTSRGVYVIGTKHQRYQEIKWPQGSTVIDPFRFIQPQDGVNVIRIGDGDRDIRPSSQ